MTFTIVTTVLTVVTLAWAFLTSKDWVRYYTVLAFWITLSIVLNIVSLAVKPNTWDTVGVIVFIALLVFVLRARRREKERVTMRDLERRLAEE
ncbi:MAG: hypothetical protein ACRD0W_09850 [Acidimicrobiales bacterium]